MRSTLALLLLFGPVIVGLSDVIDPFTSPSFSSFSPSSPPPPLIRSSSLRPMRSTLALLLLFGPVLGAAETCKLYELPATGDCTILIDWRVHDEKQALATCLEYFPTTFVKGEKVGDQTKCTVTAAYTCVDPTHFLMYDKCYSFKDSSNAITKKKISEYVKVDPVTANRRECANGKLAAVYSSTHAKFLGMRANKEGIDKLGIGMTTDGMAIDEENGKKSMLHKNLWKLIEGDYWDGEKLMKATGTAENLQYPGKAKYLFMRTRTDHVHNRVQGSFERATEDVEVTFACEFDSVFLANQEWYCNKLQALGIDSQYDKTDANSPRCLYVTAGKYMFNGQYADMANIKGCKERPSALHSAGMDEGTAAPSLYKALANKNTLRFAGIVVDKVTENKHSDAYVQGKCEGAPSEDKRKKLFEKSRYYDHHGKFQYAAASQIPWSPSHPLNECSDFPGKSSTLGLRNGLILDMPPQVRAQAVCSLRFFQTCENDKPCGAKQECTNLPEFQKSTNSHKTKEGFFKCSCPGLASDGSNQVHDEETLTSGEKICKWKDDASCAWMGFHGKTAKFLKKNSKNVPLFQGEFADYNDRLQQVVVRDGCKMSVRSHAADWDNFDLLRDAEYGTHSVPNQHDGTLAGEWEGMGASLVGCTC